MPPVKVISERLGHADVRITMAVYVYTSPTNHARVAEEVVRLLGG